MSASPGSADGGQAWESLVGTALLGTSRKPVDVAGLPPAVAAVAQASAETEPAARLLNAAAALAIYRRAGAGASVARPENAPATPEPEAGRPLSAPAAGRLADLLRGVGTNTAGMLQIWLQAAGSAGFHAPPEHLAALLDLAVSNSKLAPGVSGVLGSRGRWLARHRNDWRVMLESIEPVQVSDPADGGYGSNPAADPAWTHGTPAQRHAWFTALRRQDPAAARTVLTELDWPREDGPSRVAYICALAIGLAPDDEPLLERARADRRKDVRAAALGLLAQLPGSAYQQLLIGRARGCLRIERVRMHRRLIVTLPEPLPDGVAFAVPKWLRDHPQTGPGAVLLWYLISIVPLEIWEQSLGASPHDLVGLPVSDNLAYILHNGWDDAAIRQKNADWAMALMGARDPAYIGSLLLALPPERRQAVVTTALGRAHGPGLSATSVESILRNCAPPWSPDLNSALLSWLARESQHNEIWGAFPLLARFGESLPSDTATEAAIRALARRHPANSSWYPALAEVADTLRYRRQMLEELR